MSLIASATRGDSSQPANNAAPIDFHERIWPEVPCTVDEMGRVMTHVLQQDMHNPPFMTERSPCPSTWMCAHELGLSQMQAVRCRVMVDESKRVAMVVFKGTDTTADKRLDAHIIGAAWDEHKRVTAFAEVAATQIPIPGLQHVVSGSGLGAAVDLVWKVGSAAYNLANTGHGIDDCFGVVEQANRFVGDVVRPWAQRRDYTLIVSGHSLGGLFAHYVGYQQNLRTVAFDALYGVHAFLPTPLDTAREAQLHTVVFRENSFINWSHSQIGRIHQVLPSPQVVEGLGGAGMYHDPRFSYDYGDAEQRYAIHPSLDELAQSYVDAVVQRDAVRLTYAYFVLHLLHTQLRENRLADGIDFFRYLEVFDLRTAVFQKMASIMGNPVDVPATYGEDCFLNRNGYSSTASQKSEAIAWVLREKLIVRR